MFEPRSARKLAGTMAPTATWIAQRFGQTFASMTKAHQSYANGEDYEEAYENALSEAYGLSKTLEDFECPDDGAPVAQPDAARGSTTMPPQVVSILAAWSNDSNLANADNDFTDSFFMSRCT